MGRFPALVEQGLTLVSVCQADSVHQIAQGLCIRKFLEQIAQYVDDLDR